MYKTIFASIWIATAMAALFLGLSGVGDPALMIVSSLFTLGLFYIFALWVVVVNTREPQHQSVKR